MARRAKRPMDRAATKRANDRFNAAHPERNGKPLKASDPVALRREWMDYYEEEGGPVTGGGETKPRPRAKSECPEEWIKICVVDDETDERIGDVNIQLDLPSIGKSGVLQVPRGGTLYLAHKGKIGNTDAGGSSTVDRDAAVRSGLTAALEVVKVVAHPGDEAFEAGTAPVRARRSGPYHLMELRPHTVAAGDTVATVASSIAMSVEDMYRFNFGCQPGAPHFPATVTNYTGCVNFDAEGTPLFVEACKPGVIHGIGDWSVAGLAPNAVHEIRVRGIKRRHDIELQTVDELNLRMPNVKLRLWPSVGAPIDLATDKDGYVKLEDVEFAGSVTVTDENNQVLHEGRLAGAIEGEADNGAPAVIDPMRVRSTVTTIRVPRLSGKERRQLGDVHARYGSVDRTPLERAATTRRRFFNNGVDNLFIAAGWDHAEKRIDVKELWSLLGDWMRDRHGVTHRRGMVLTVLDGTGVSLWAAGTEEEARIAFRPNCNIRGQYGAYAVFEDSGGDLFTDMRGQVMRSTTGGRAILAPFFGDERLKGHRSVTDMLDEDGARRYQKFRQRHAAKVDVMYHVPPSFGRWVMAARHGGLGMLEDYAPSGDPLFDRIQGRNVDVLKSVAVAYERYLDAYIARVESIGTKKDDLPTSPQGMSAYVVGLGEEDGAGDPPAQGEKAAAPEPSSPKPDLKPLKAAPFAVRCEWALKQLGPPEAPFQFPLPYGLHDYDDAKVRSARLELAEQMVGSSSFRAWKAISDMLARVHDDHPAGSMRIAASFEPTAELTVHRGVDVAGGLGIANAQAKVGQSAFFRAKVKGNVDFDETTGELRPHMDWEAPKIEVGVRDVDCYIGGNLGGGLGITGKAALQASRYIQVDTRTGDYKRYARLHFGLGSSWAGPARWANALFPKEAFQNKDGKLKGTKVLIPDFTIEVADDGEVRMDLKRMTATANVRDGWVSMQKCFAPAGPSSRWSLFTESATLSSMGEFCVGVRFELANRDTTLAVVAGAPGFFESVDLYTLLSPGATWNHLTEEIRESLVLLGWSMGTWDRKHEPSFPDSEWPACVRKRWVDLTAKERIAAIHLGFRGGKNRGNWASEWRRIGAPMILVPTDMFKEAAGKAGGTFMGPKVKQIAEKHGPAVRGAGGELLKEVVGSQVESTVQKGLDDFFAGWKGFVEGQNLEERMKEDGGQGGGSKPAVEPVPAATE